MSARSIRMPPNLFFFQYLDPLPFCMGSTFLLVEHSHSSPVRISGGQVSTVHFLRSSAAPELPQEMYYKKSSISYRRQEAQKFPNRNVLQQYVRYIYMYRYSCTATGSLPVPVVHFLRAFSVSTPVGAPVLHTSIVLEFPTSDDLYVNSMWGPNGHLGPTPNS